MKHWRLIAFLAVLVFLQLFHVGKVGEISFYNGMMNYCLYVPFYYLDGVAAYRDQEGCDEIVDDARAKGLYYNPRQLEGPGRKPVSFPGVDG